MLFDLNWSVSGKMLGSRKLSTFFMVFLIASICFVRPASAQNYECAACTVIVKLIDEASVVYQEPIDEIVHKMCGLFPHPISDLCDHYVLQYGDDVIKYLVGGMTPDQVCRVINICTKPGCKLFQNYRAVSRSNISPLEPELFSKLPLRESKAIPDVNGNPFDWLIERIRHVMETHEPFVDLDGDLYGSLGPLRGSNWRGKDCDDGNAKIRPGVMDPGYPAVIDYNCNGIKGVNPKTGNSYQDDMCPNTCRSLFIFGDSATAHFSIPAGYLEVANFTLSMFEDLPQLLMNEFDWPHLSWGTAHMNDTTGLEPGEIDSLYLRMLKRDRCMHRQFVNSGVNGAEASHLRGQVWASGINKTHCPVSAFVSVIGNDICNNDVDDPIGAMTTPAEFEASIYEFLDEFHRVAPVGSHIIFSGLVNGSVIHEATKGRIHPIGVPYIDVYEYLTCEDCSPCIQWMNNNATLRAIASERAHELSMVYPKIIEESSAKYADVFVMEYIQNPIHTLQIEIERRHEHLGDYLEAVDGFHPSQKAQPMLAQIIYDKTSQSEFWPDVNPNNDAIEARFGDQGGY